MSNAVTMPSVRNYVTIPQTGIELPTWVMAALATVPQGFTGRIELNCAHGGVSNMNLLWSVKPS